MAAEKLYTCPECMDYLPTLAKAVAHCEPFIEEVYRCTECKAVWDTEDDAENCEHPYDENEYLEEEDQEE